MKVIIAGSRTFDDYQTLKKICDHMLSESTNIEIVSGTANGADKLGEKYAEENGYPITKFPADWNRFGKSAGYVRNEEMAKYADALIAFHVDGSKGTQHMIDLAKKYNLKVKIYSV